MRLRNVSINIGILIGLFSGSVHAQNRNTGTLIPPSPNAASLGQYGNSQPNYSSGAVNLAIPVYDYQTSKLSLPISLSYTSTGFKVDEVASRVGTGWALNAGGVITRTVFGAIDEYSEALWPTEQEFGLYTSRQVISFVNKISGDLVGDTRAGPMNPYDGEPDLFNFNINGKSGRFLLKYTNQNGSRVCQPILLNHSGMKIESGLNLTPLRGFAFRMTADDGVQYIFNQAEYTTNNAVAQGQCDGANYTGIATAWYLTQVVHPNRDTINLSYTNLTYQYYTGIAQTIYGKSPNSPWDQCQGQSGFWPVLTDNVCTNRLQTAGVLLSEISSSTGEKVKLNYISRNDNNDRLVSSIEIYHPKNSTAFTVFDLAYQYATDRPFLTSITERNTANTVNRKHEFTYNNLGQVPSQLSYSQDHWGYYNGKSNTTLIPKATDIEFQRYLPQATGNREPDGTYCQVGLLSNIKYPTGGTETISYEGNTAYDWVTVPATPSDVDAYANGTEWPDPIYSNAATLTTQQYVDLTADYSPDPQMDDQQGFVGIVNAATNQEVWGLILTSAQSISQQISLPPGTYKIKLTYYGQGALSANMHYLQGTYTREQRNVNTGGVRVAKISRFDPVSNTTQIIKYNYNRFDNPSISSGIQNLPPVYEQLLKMRKECIKDGFETCENIIKAEYLTMHSSSIYSLYGSTGTAVSYEHVAESLGENGENGMIQHGFNVPVPDGAGSPLYGDFITGTPAIEDNQLNKEIYTGVFRKESNSFLPVKKTFTHYVDDPRIWKMIPGYTANKKFSYSCANAGEPTDAEMSSFDLSIHTIYCKWVYADTIKVQEFDNSGLNYIEQLSITQYANPQHALATNVRIFNSKDDSLKTTYAYPSDFPGTAVYDTMAKRNFLAPVIQQEQFINTSLVSKKKVNYVLFNTGRLALPASEELQYSSNAPFTTVQYLRYDNSGNLLEVLSTEAGTISYIWGYGGRYPVAQIQGAAYDTAIAFVNTGIVNAPTDDQQLRAEIGKIRSGLAGRQVLVTTCTYLPPLGMTSKTDPSGNMTSYEYDGFGRLKLIKDRDGKILNQYDYQYQKPVTQ